MKAVTRILFLDDNGNKFFGEGPCRLLEGVEETGSLRASAAREDMAYDLVLYTCTTGGKTRVMIGCNRV